MKMGQVLSNILGCICRCGEAEDESDQNPRETSSHFLISPTIPPLKTITRTEFLQTNSSEYSCIDPSIITTPVSNPPPPPPPDLSDLVCGDSTSNTVALHQNLLNSPPQSSVLDYLSTTKDTSTLFSSLVSEESIIISDEESNLKEPPPGEKEEGIEEEEKVVINKAVPVIEERWIKHFSSFQKILLVGEGDFSFSASLGMAFGSAHNIVATSFNTTGYLSRNYRSAMSNIRSLRSRGAKVMHGVDATQMAGQILFPGMTFDRIVFNFPLSGFFADDSRESKLRRERKLVRLFIVNAREMIAEGGEIHVTHKSNGFFREWNLEQLASSVGLQFIDEVHFNFTDFPGYRTKYGFGVTRISTVILAKPINLVFSLRLQQFSRRIMKTNDLVNRWSEDSEECESGNMRILVHNTGACCAVCAAQCTMQSQPSKIGRNF